MGVYITVRKMIVAEATEKSFLVKKLTELTEYRMVL